MSLAKSSEVFSSLHMASDHMQACSFKEYEEQVVAYFSGRSGNTRFQCDSEKIKKRFKKACKEVKRFINLREKDEEEQTCAEK